jgi:uracil-DNA glycosylase
MDPLLSPEARPIPGDACYAGAPVYVALGATAAFALTGKFVSILRARGEADFTPRGGYITLHPSYLLRISDAAAMHAAIAAFLADLRHVRELADA